MAEIGDSVGTGKLHAFTVIGLHIHRIDNPSHGAFEQRRALALK
jgi:hypothetical protein